MAGFRNILLITLLLVTLAGIAQRVKPSFNLNGAVALPQEDFGSKDIDNPKSGIAKPGLEYGFDFGLQFRSSPVACYCRQGFIRLYIRFKYRALEVDKLFAGYFRDPEY